MSDPTANEAAASENAAPAVPASTAEADSNPIPATLSGEIVSQSVDTMPVDGPVSMDNLDLILGVQVTVSVEVGSTRIPIRRLLQMTKGSVLELDQQAGQAMDVLVNGTPIAHGEVVMVEDRVGIRLTDVISAKERVRSIS